MGQRAKDWVERSVLIEKTERSFRLVELRAYSSESDTTNLQSSIFNNKSIRGYYALER
jgi:hypothetical protein